ncbi:MAG: hypothetical protein JWN56_1433 [Sphingobacteriales bacterium]|nr:hypothetical protein [Sphingobacteriales bacterium]
MNNKVKICVISQAHLCCNPRVLKEVLTLSELGYEIFVITSGYSKEFFQNDLSLIKNHKIKMVYVSDLSKNDIHSFIDRLLKKLGTFLVKFLSLETSLALGYGSFRYYRICKSVNANLYICHQELATYIGNKLIKSNYKVAYDIEDWYSEDLLPQARNERPLNLLQKAESIALNKGIFCTTTSHALAIKLAQAYSCKLPHTIYNVFPSQITLIEKYKEFCKPLKLFWFSQTIGSGRGLEQFIFLTNFFHYTLELHLLGNIDISYREKLKMLMPIQHHLYFHEIVSEQKLAEKIATFDIGLALELTVPLSRNYTITNKFFQYIQSGLPIIASKTHGQNEAFEKFKPGIKLSQNPSEKEIIEVENWLSNPIELQSARQKAIEAAHTFNWENESKTLIHLVENALNVTR